jgi:hypothetical protein
MRARGISGWVAIVFLLAYSGTALSQEHRGPDVFAQVMRSMHGLACPLISDPVGNAGGNPVDFKALYVSNDATNVYFLVEFAGDASRNTISPIWLDTDIDQTTGCQLGIPRFNGAEYDVFLAGPTFGGSFIGNQSLCSAGSDDFPNRGGIQTQTVGHFIAVIVPISTLQILTPAVNGFSVSFNGGGNFGPAVYLFH